MTPEEKKQLEVHIQEIAKILYKNTPADKIETFEGIEYSVREQGVWSKVVGKRAIAEYT